MPFQKGKPKTGGRDPGTPNRTTQEAKDFLKQVVFSEFDNIKESLAKARAESDSKYIDLLTRLLSFVLPKQVEEDHSGVIQINVEYKGTTGGSAPSPRETDIIP
jgi:hypothetical protein